MLSVIVKFNVRIIFEEYKLGILKTKKNHVLYWYIGCACYSNELVGKSISNKLVV